MIKAATDVCFALSMKMNHLANKKIYPNVDFLEARQPAKLESLYTTTPKYLFWLQGNKEKKKKKKKKKKGIKRTKSAMKIKGKL